MSHADRGAQLLDVARAVFVERGYQGASMAEVAARAGVSKPVVYDHFASKEGLLAAVMGQAGEQLRVAVAAAVAGADGPRAALSAGVVAYLRFVEAQTSAYLLLLAEAGAAAAASVELIRDEQAAFTAGLIAATLTGRDRARRGAFYAQVVVGACERAALVRLRDPAVSAEVAARRVLDVLWTGLGALTAPAAAG